MYRITPEDVDELERDGHPDWVVARAKRWLADSQCADRLVQAIEAAFCGTKLGTGIGLFEAKGLDDYRSMEELKTLRAKDEKHDWRRIPDDHLNECNSSPSFFDASGLVFHLPAFMSAELRGAHNFGFFDRLLNDGFSCGDIRKALTNEQRAVICQCLEFLGKSPDYEDSASEIEAAIAKYRGSSE